MAFLSISCVLMFNFRLGKLYTKCKSVINEMVCLQNVSSLCLNINGGITAATSQILYSILFLRKHLCQCTPCINKCVYTKHMKNASKSRSNKTYVLISIYIYVYIRDLVQMRRCAPFFIIPWHIYIILERRIFVIYVYLNKI